MAWLDKHQEPTETAVAVKFELINDDNECGKRFINGVNRAKNVTNIYVEVVVIVDHRNYEIPTFLQIAMPVVEDSPST